MTGTSPVSGTTSPSAEAKALKADERLLADLQKHEGPGRWADSLRDWTLAAIFAAAIALGGRYVNGLLEGFSPEGTSWL